MSKNPEQNIKTSVRRNRDGSLTKQISNKVSGVTVETQVSGKPHNEMRGSYREASE